MDKQKTPLATGLSLEAFNACANQHRQFLRDFITEQQFGQEADRDRAAAERLPNSAYHGAIADAAGR